MTVEMMVLTGGTRRLRGWGIGLSNIDSYMPELPCAPAARRISRAISCSILLASTIMGSFEKVLINNPECQDRSTSDPRLDPIPILTLISATCRRLTNFTV